MKSRSWHLRRFPEEWFKQENYTPTGGSEQREVGFNRQAHASHLLSGVRQAYLSKPKDAFVGDSHIYFAARTWRNRPSLRRNLDSVRAKVYRVLGDGTVISGWRSLEDYEYTKKYLSEYGAKHAKIADLDYIESIKGLDPQDKLGSSLLEVLEAGDVTRAGQLAVSFYPDYTEQQVEEIDHSLAEHLGRDGLVFDRLVHGLGRYTSFWRGPLYLAEQIAKGTEAAAIVEQVGELRPAGTAANVRRGSAVKVAVRPGLPEVGVLDTGVSGSHPLLQGVLLSGDKTLDHEDQWPDGGHGTFVAGILAYGEDPASLISNNQIQPRVLIHPRKVHLQNAPSGINLDFYNELAVVVEQLRSRTRVFTVSISEAVPIDSDNVGQVALNLDELAHRYGVLFVLPTGNLPNLSDDGQPAPDQPNYDDMGSWCDDSNARMGRPGEAFNALTVGSIAERQVGQEYSQPGHAAPYSRRGPGPKGIPKPDVAAAGGNCVVYDNPDYPQSVTFDCEEDPQASITGLRAPEGFHKAFGTSFAVPKVAFALSTLVSRFESLKQSATAPLLAKAYLTHICRLPEEPGPLPEHWTEDEKLERMHLLYGHGVPDIAALEALSPSEVCFYASGILERRKRHIYALRFPSNVLNCLPDLLLRVTLAYFAPVDSETLDAELYSLVEIVPVVRWGAKTLPKIPRGGPLTEYYPLKSFEVRFPRPRDGAPSDKGLPTVEVLMKDRMRDADEVRQQYALLISLVSPTGELLVNDLIQEIENE